MFQDEVAQRCVAEWERFERSKAREWWDPQYKRIGEYWRALNITRNGRTGIEFKKKSNGDLVLVDGQPVPKDNKNKNPPWSAAFISFMAREAGAGSSFKYRGYHSLYIMAALREAGKTGSTAKWIARRRTTYKPKVGDLIACGRASAAAATYDTAESYIDNTVDTDFFPSHTDFVVEVASAHVMTIGGNVGNSVGRKKWPLNSSGRIGTHDPRSPSASVICIIECRL